jgi:hypothetical protein
MNTASSVIPTVGEPDRVRPEFASAAVVYVPETPDVQTREIETRARRASRSNGFGASEACEEESEARGRESLMQILCRVAADLVRRAPRGFSGFLAT